MPVDTSATSYEWYFDVPEDEREVRLTWVPHTTPISSSLANGVMQIEKRVAPVGKDTWVWERVHTAEAMWITAQAYAKREGMSVEVAKHGG